MIKESELPMANCRRNIVPTSMFFEEFEEVDTRQRMKIIAICDSCEIKNSCLKDAMSHKETYGLWGGKFFKKGRVVELSTIRRPRPTRKVS